MTATAGYDRHGVVVYPGDCLAVLAELGDASVDAVVTDPPYALAFMGKGWDSFEPPAFARWCQQWAVECLRVLKPGGHLAAFGGTRTYHRLTSGIEDAGFEIRDGLQWLYGSGFPKSLDVAKAIDRQRDDRPDIVAVTTWLAAAAAAAGITRRDVDDHMGTSDMAGWWLTDLAHRCQVPTWEQWLQLRELIGCGDDMDAEVWRLNGRKGTPGEAWDTAEVLRTETRAHAPSGLVGVGQEPRNVHGTRHVKAPNTAGAQQWHGWGTALKPAHEPIVLARKPLTGTVAATVLEHGTGALNVDGCRTGTMAPRTIQGQSQNAGELYGADQRDQRAFEPSAAGRWPASAAGRWPANVLLTHLPDCGPDEDPQPCRPGCPVADLDQQSGSLSSGHMRPDTSRATRQGAAYGTMFARTPTATYGDTGGASRFFPTFRWEAKAPTSQRPQVDGEAHPTVKPVALMRWLVRLLTPPGGLVCDPFAGTGTTLQAARAEGMRAIGIERDPSYLPLIRARLDARPRTTTPAAPAPAAVADDGPWDLFDLLDGTP